jgi:hypothetical protein
MNKTFALSGALLAAACGLAMSGPANAAVVAGPTVAGLGTFIDTNTGRDWLRLDNFFAETALQMQATANAAGFTVANEADVLQLTNSLPLAGGQWPAYAAVMGSAPNRQLMWGADNPAGSGNWGWAFAFNGDSAWTQVDNIFPGDQVPNNGNNFSDENIWAFRTGGTVPEPGVWAMMLIGLGGLGALARTRRGAALKA